LIAAIIIHLISIHRSHALHYTLITESLKKERSRHKMVEIYALEEGSRSLPSILIPIDHDDDTAADIAAAKHQQRRQQRRRQLTNAMTLEDDYKQT